MNPIFATKHSKIRNICNLFIDLKIERLYFLIKILGNLIISWILGIAFSILPFFSPNQYVLEGFQTSCSFDFIDQSQFNRILIIISNVFGFFIPIVIMLTNNFLIFFYLKKNNYFTNISRKCKNDSAEDMGINAFQYEQEETELQWMNNISIEWQITKNTLFIMCGFCLAW